MKDVLKKQLLLYAITYENLELDILLRQVESALRGGATALQLREKNLKEEDYLHRALAVKEIANRYGVPLIIDDSVFVALKSGASGAHVGQKDVDPRLARDLLGRDKILGVSVRTAEQAKKAEDSGADYLGVGAVFPTQTKKDHVEIDLQTLNDICSSVSIPVVAIGGIKLGNVGLLKGSGIAGIAVVSGIFASQDVEETTRRFRIRIEEEIAFA